MTKNSKKWAGLLIGLNVVCLLGQLGIATPAIAATSEVILLQSNVSARRDSLLGNLSVVANSPFDGFTVCVPGAGEVYVGGYFRMPTTSTATAVLQVTTPAGLTSGANTIAFSQISWTSTSIGNAGAADIPAGSFVSGGTRFLRNFAANSYVENCHAFSYANATPVAAGTYAGRATYTLTAP